MATNDIIHWIFAKTDGLDLFEDHRNLIFLFDQLIVEPDLSKSSLCKVLCWGVLLSA